MITYKSEREINQMKKAGEISARIFNELKDYIEVGMTTNQIDKYVEKRIRELGAIPAQIGYQGYKYATCTSVNEEICHGFPTDYKLKSGDIVKVDFCVDLNGAISDSCYCFEVGEVDPKVKQLVSDTKKAMYLGIEQAVVGNRIGDIGHAIQTFAEERGYGVVRDFVGHGVGPTIHEDPQVPHYGLPGRGTRLKEGMTITVEPMITLGDWRMVMSDNGWTASTVDDSWCAQFEHTIAITKDGPYILTSRDDVALKMSEEAKE